MTDDWNCLECEQENTPEDTECCACEAPKPAPPEDPRYKGYKVGVVKSVEAIPKTKLKELKIDVGGKEDITVVTNAKNMNETGVKVVVATVGAVVVVDGDDVEVKKSTVGGRKSEGMLCDAPALGWKGGAAGLAVILPDEFAVGSAPPSSKPRTN
ncbi:hypothetical protein HDU67_000662 [Dinochytrium kinnereticum]|nr:hypothetical protein HDU67_000662 [Dinochytrium kinnereticum]